MPKTRSSRTKKADSDDDSTDYQAIVASSDDDSSVEEDKRMPATKSTPKAPSTQKKASTKPANATSNRKQVKMAGDPPIDSNTVPFVSWIELMTRHKQVQAETVPFSNDEGFWLWYNMDEGKGLHDYDVERRRDEKNVVDVKSKALLATTNDLHRMSFP